MYRFKPKKITPFRDAPGPRRVVALHPDGRPHTTEPALPFRLRIEHASGAFETMAFAFARDRVAIGRAATNEAWLSNALCSVSRQHAEIFRKAGRLWLVDLGSKNGTWLNGQRLEAHRSYALQHGDSFQIGGYRFDVILERAFAYPLAS